MKRGQVENDINITLSLLDMIIQKIPLKPALKNLPLHTFYRKEFLVIIYECNCRKIRSH